MKCRCGRKITGSYISTGGHYYHPNCMKMREMGWREGYEAYPKMNEKKFYKRFRSKYTEV